MNSQGYYTITLNDNYNISNAYHNVGSHRHAIVQTNGTSVLSLTGGGSVTGNGAVHYYTPIRLEGGSGSSYAFREPNLSIYGTVSGTAGAGGNYDLILAGGGTVATPGAPNASYVGSLADGAGGGTLSIVKTETGIWTLSNSNSFSGATTVRNGRLKFGHVHAFGTGNMPIVLGDSGTGAGDTLDLEHANNNTMTRNIVINNSNPSGASILSVRNSLGTPVFSGQVNLNRAVTVHTEGGGYPTFSGKITGSGGLVKTGPDRVTLSGNENDYQGGTTMNAGLFIASGTGALGSGPAAVYGGVLRANQGVGLPVNVPLMLNGGVWESSAAITRSLGSGAGQLQLSNYAGFSASGAISVNINGGAGLAWGSTAGFNPTTLVLNETTAAAQLTFQNALDLNGADRIIAVNANTAIISNSLGNTSGTAGLVKTGAGTLILAGSNSFNGGLTVNAGALIIRSNNTYTGTTRVNGSTLTLDYTNRNTGVVLVPGATPLVLSNGVFSVNGSGMAGQSTLQTVSGLTLVAGANTVSVAAHGSRPAVLNLGAIARSLSSSCTANFILPGGTQDAANGITTSSGAANTRLGWWATVNGSEWAAKDADNDNIVAWSAVGGTYVDVTRLSSGTKRIVSNPVSDIRIIDGTGTAGNITNAAAGTTDIATLFAAVTGGTATYDPGSTDVLRLSATGSVVLTGAAGSGALTLGAITNDGVLTAGGAANTAGLLTFCNNHGANLITINASIANNGTGIVGLEKTGPGTVVLTANNYPFTGTNTILAGALEYQFPSTVAPTVIGGGVLLNGGTLRYQETGGNAGATLKDSVTVGAGGGAIDFRALASGGGQFTPVMVGTIVLGGNLTLQSLGNTHACVSGVTLSNLAFTVNSPVIYNDVVNTDSPNGAKVMLPASLAAPTRTLNLAGTVPLPAGQLTKFQINGATSNSLNLANLAMGAGSSLYLISGSTTNPLSQIKANGGSLIMGSGSSLTLQGTVSTPGPVFDPAAVTWQGENSLVFERDPTGNRDSWMQIVDNLTVSTAGGLVQLTAIPWRQSLTIAAGKTLTIGAGGTLVWTVGSQVNEFINGNIALLDGSVVTPSYSIAANNQGGLIRGTTGTLTLGDGSGTTSTPSVVTVRGDQAGYLNTFKIGYVTNTVESGVVKMKYASTSSAAGSAFVVGWSAAGTYSANLAAFRETRGGTEFAPQAGGGGVAVVGAASGPVALFSNMVTVSTGGTVGFYNAGANNTRGSLGAVVVTNGGSLAFTTNGLIQASNVVFRSGATLRVALTSAATNGCSLVFASGPLTFEGNTEIAISEGFGLTACRGPWYVARGAMLSGLPRKTSSLYSVTVEGGALRIDRASPGTLITIR
jgi:autotransporter-associated beta strand protein